MHMSNTTLFTVFSFRCLFTSQTIQKH